MKGLSLLEFAQFDSCNCSKGCWNDSRNSPPCQTASCTTIRSNLRGSAPVCLVPYGGCIFLNDGSMVLDQTGVMSWDQQFMALLNAAPLIGFILGYGMLGSAQGEKDFNNWVKQTFSQQLSSG
jgi:hypothetical protein